MRFARFCGLAAAALMAGTARRAGRRPTLTIATVNNGDMIVMQKLSPKFEKADRTSSSNWVVLEENVLRQRVTTDIATKGGSFDVMTIGAYETPIWGKQGWLLPLDDLGDDYDYNDLVPQVKAGLSVDGKMYAAPFYAESSLDLLSQGPVRQGRHQDGRTSRPTQQIAEYADKLTDKANGIYGICLRGKPGWGENMAFLGTAAIAFGGAWFDDEVEAAVHQRSRGRRRSSGISTS